MRWSVPAGNNRGAMSEGDITVGIFDRGGVISGKAYASAGGDGKNLLDFVLAGVPKLDAIRQVVSARSGNGSGTAGGPPSSRSLHDEKR